MNISTRRLLTSIRVYLKTVNTPKQRVFSVCCAPFSLAIHKVFLRKNGFSRRKIPRCWSYSRFSDRPYEGNRRLFCLHKIFSRNFEKTPPKNALPFQTSEGVNSEPRKRKPFTCTLKTEYTGH